MTFDNPSLFPFHAFTKKTKGFTIISSINMVFFQQKSLPLSTHSTIKTAIASALYTNKYGKTKKLKLKNV